ncbi:hypothetical protein Tco_0654891 [Tanacetum coccineum]|uniref:Uncharacterized protein n=1 Tax=Tanacetum coccineum TaxID=301880 RepID=A0ABQ4X4H1_9ASTR
MNEYKGIMPTKIELTLEQSQQGVSNDVLVSIEGVEELKRNIWIKGENQEPSTYFRQKSGQYIIYQIHKDELWYKQWCCSLIPAESDSLPHVHTQTIKTYYKHQDLRIKKAQELKTKTSAYSDIKDNSLETKLQGRLLASFQEDAKYEHVGQDTRSQDGKDDQDKQGKYLKISKLKSK